MEQSSHRSDARVGGGLGSIEEDFLLRHLAFERTNHLNEPEPEGMRRTLHPRPPEQREGFPGTYTLHIQPEEFWIQTVVQIGSTVIQPRTQEQGYYVVSFDFETGEVHDHFRLSADGMFAQYDSALPYFVYVLAGE